MVFAASTKPAAAIVFPEAVGWRKRKRLTAPGSSPGATASATSSSSESSSGPVLLEVFLLVVRALLELHGVPVAVAVPVLRFVLVPGDQLGQHPGERVDLVAAQLRSRREPGRAVGQHALEAEHERVVHLPLGRRGAPAGVHLEECSVERTPACVALGEHVSGAFAGVEDGLP